MEYIDCSDCGKTIAKSFPPRNQKMTHEVGYHMVDGSIVCDRCLFRRRNYNI